MDGLSDRVIYHVYDSTYEENFKGRCEVGPNVAVDLYINIPSVYVSLNINSCDCWDLFTIRQGSLPEREAGLNHNCADINFNVTSGNQKAQTLVSKFIIDEFTA